MNILMKALATFRGKGEEGRPRKGREFTTETEARAKELEAHKLAVRINTKMESTPLNKMEAAPLNKDELALSAGGQTGAETSPSSSAPARPQRVSTSRGRGGKQGS